MAYSKAKLKSSGDKVGRNKWEEYIEMDLTEMRCDKMDRTYLAQDNSQRKARVNIDRAS
jgi:hypothetical protein